MQYELSVDIKNKLDKIAEKGNKYADSKKNDKAINTWKEGLSLIPEPINMYSETIWFEVAIGDLLYQEHKYTEAFKYFNRAQANLTGEGYRNPFIMLRLGQCYFELNDEKNATEYLLRAYMIEGINIFEYEDNKYLSYLKSVVNDIK